MIDHRRHHCHTQRTDATEDKASETKQQVLESESAGYENDKTQKSKDDHTTEIGKRNVNRTKIINCDDFKTEKKRKKKRNECSDYSDNINEPEKRIKEADEDPLHCEIIEFC